jgi:hypothetical protein
MSTNFSTRGLKKAFAYFPIPTLLASLIVATHASDAMSLDTSFGTDGKVTTSFSAGNDVGSGIAVQSDDKIVVVGHYICQLFSHVPIFSPIFTMALKTSVDSKALILLFAC